VIGTKVTPPERDLLRYMGRQYWMTAAKIGEFIGRPQSWVQSHLRRLQVLGYVEARQDTAKVYRLTTLGREWKRDHPA
jgi:DNA-binding MarR family transcriptional regulator